MHQRRSRMRAHISALQLNISGLGNHLISQRRKFMSHRNEDMIRNNYEAFTRGDAKPLLDSLSEDIQWHVSGQSPIAGDYFGKAKVLEFFAGMMDLYQGTLRLQILDVMAN